MRGIAPINSVEIVAVTTVGATAEATLPIWNAFSSAAYSSGVTGAEARS